MVQQVEPELDNIRRTELNLQRGLQAWIFAGLAFMLLPGTYLGAWNLIAIAGRHRLAGADPAWLQAHGHAQIFGWIGSFILGIGFYSLTKMAHVPPFAVWRMWLSWSFWSLGVALRWAANLWRWQWRWMLPVSAVFEFSAFLLFFATVSHHRPAPGSAAAKDSGSRTWIWVVAAGTLGFLAGLLGNLAAALQVAVSGAGPAIPHEWNQRLLVLFTWAFPVVTIWGFSARWLPVFLGLHNPDSRLLVAALLVNLGAVAIALAGLRVPATALFLTAAGLSAAALRIFQRGVRPAKITGVHSTFPGFVRAAYFWLLASAVLSVLAAGWDKAGGLWGASRHALTVGFVATMVFAIGQRVLPAFCGMRVLFSPRLMFVSLMLLNGGCAIRVISEAGAYEGYWSSLWPLLPVSAITEMAAVTVFAANLALTILSVGPKDMPWRAEPAARRGLSQGQS